jgi:nicotinate-nucleotide adenylyltransferase
VKSAILGGSFNPVHNGHLRLAEEVLGVGYDRILFIPAANPPHKTLEHGATDEERLDMLRIALSGIDWAVMWDGEIRRGGTSYTIDTIRELKKISMVGGRPGLIIGDDLTGGFSHWREVDALVSETQLIVARRTGDKAADFSYPCVYLNNEIWPYSSTEVRQLIHGGRNPVGLVPAGVAEYIENKGLYGNSR